jgi:hypothetical protein
MENWWRRGHRVLLSSFGHVIILLHTRAIMASWLFSLPGCLPKIRESIIVRTVAARLSFSCRRECTQLNNNYVCIRTLPQILLRTLPKYSKSGLTNASTSIQQRWRVQPDPVLWRRYSRAVCYTFAQIGTGGGHLARSDG